MFGIGSTELLVIIVVALVVLGPKSIPQIAKTVGKVVGEFRRVSTDFQRTLNAEAAQEEHEERKKVAEKELFGDTPSASAPPTTVVAAPVPDATTSPPVAAQAPDKPTEPVPNPDSPLAHAVAKAEAEAKGTAA